MISSRLVLIFPGFEKTTSASQLDRVEYCAQKTGEVWNFQHRRKSVTIPFDSSHAESESLTKGANWQTSTFVVLFSWNDIIEEYESLPHPKGFLRNMPKFIAFFADGTVWRYLKASHRYFYFTIYPVLLLALFALLSATASWFVAGLALSGTVRILACLAASIALTLLLCKNPGERWYLLMTINDWGFARDMVNRSNPQIEQRYKIFAEKLAREISRSKHDEIVISGHSFGAVWAVAALANALAGNPRLLEGKRIIFLALGSSLLKIALAPRAAFLRQWIADLTALPTLFWHEIQTKTDIIAFYKSDPFKVLGIGNIKSGLQIDRVNYKRAMASKRYRKMRRSQFETHRQYILYQDNRVPFDYMLRLFGPLDAKVLATSPDEINRIDAAGRLM